MTRFSFLHAADIHLDSPLRGLSRYDGVPADEVRTATRAALDNLVETAIDRRVDFVIIAGDLYDGDTKDVGAGLAVAAAMGRLGRAGIQTYLLQGNHDAEAVITRTLPPIETVRTFNTRKPQTHRHPTIPVAIHGQSFARREVFENLAARYPAPEPGHFNIGVLHTSLAGHAEHESYAPCTPQELASQGYDYWALGHVHEHRIVSEHPHIVFPGNLQGRNIREHGAKGAVLVEVEDNRVESLTHLALDVVRWATLTLDTTNTPTMAVLQDHLRRHLHAVAQQAEGRPLLVRIVLAGVTPLHGPLQDWLATGRDDVRAIAAEVSRDIWIEKIQVRTTAPQAATQLGAAEDLASLLADPDDTLHERLHAEFAPFLAAIRPFDPSSPLEHARTGDWSALIDRAAAALRARMGLGQA